MSPEKIKIQVRSIQEYFNRSTKTLKEEHSGYAPQPGMFTVAAQVAHVAQTIEWFIDAAVKDEWRMEFEAMDKEVRACASLAEARAWFDRAIAAALAAADSYEGWSTMFGPNPILGEVPRYVILNAISDHTAHHRGALTVYQRMLGITPPMPYMDM